MLIWLSPFFELDADFDGDVADCRADVDPIFGIAVDI